ncbi:unnamed protein product, partial [Prorocentrum cordatum]
GGGGGGGGRSRASLRGQPARQRQRSRPRFLPSLSWQHGDCTLHTAPLRSTTACAGKSRDSVRLRLQPHPSFGCASHLQGTRESRNRWARPPSAGRRAASRRVEKAITKNPAPSAATTKSARSTCLCTVGNSQLQHTCAPQGAGIVSNPTAPGAMLPQRRAQRC